MKITLLIGHPNPDSFCHTLGQTYIDGLKHSNHEYRYIDLSQLTFDPILHKGYNEIQPLEPDLIQAQKDIEWCNHFVVVHPMWWGSMPAVLKGFVDRTFLPGWAFKYHENDPFWDRLLSGRSARLIITSDAPALFNQFVYWNAPITVPKKMFLKFCGFKPVRITAIGAVKYLNDQKKEKTLKKVYQLGQKAI